MGKNISGKIWPYAGLSKMAKQYGGPEIMLQTIKNAERIKGGAIGAGIVIVGVVVAVYEWPKIKSLIKCAFSKKDEQTLEDEIIEGIKKYDREQSAEEVAVHEELDGMKRAAKPMIIGGGPEKKDDC